MSTTVARFFRRSWQECIRFLRSQSQLLISHHYLGFRPHVLFVVLAFSVLACNQEKRPDWSSAYGNDQPGRYFNIRGFKMYVETYGEGEPLLLIHGNGGSVKQFVNQIPYFSRKYQVIVADSRAQGKSIDNSDSLSYEMMADDFNELLDSMKLDSAYVIGWSDGGINGLLLASRHPQKVKKLAALGANLWPDTTALQTDFLHILDSMHTAVKNIEQKNDSVKRQLKLIELGKEQPHIPLESLQKVTCPALIIAGDNDLIKLQHTVLIYQNLPKAYLWILPNTGHAALFSHKDEFNKTVDDFFSQRYRSITGRQRFQ